MIKVYFDHLILLLTVLPLTISFLIRICFNIINNKLVTIISIVGTSIMFIITLYFFSIVLAIGFKPLNNTWYVWGNFVGLKFQFGYLIDKLTIIMLNLTISLSLIIQIYSSVFMKNEVDYKKYFSCLAFFNFSMTFLIISNNLLQLFFGWELLGLSSYLLINFWFKNKIVNLAAFKTFFINKIGDCSLLAAIALILKYFHSLEYDIIFANTINIIHDLPNIKLIIALLVLASLVKSAQLPLHLWLPDAMEGPLPVSALLHSSTLVTIGVFFLIRMSPMLQLSSYCLNIILFIGTVSAILASVLALVEIDLKRIMAYSTISHIGIMFAAIGCSAYIAGIFHLITHAFVKCLLFLSIGSIYYLHNIKDNNIFKLSLHLKESLPITYYCFLIGSLSLVGFPGTSIFFSKNLIFNILKNSSLAFANKAYCVLLFTNIITSLYMFRLVYIVFHGANNKLLVNAKNIKPNIIKYDLFVINGSMIILSVISLTIGYFLISPIVEQSMFNMEFSKKIYLLFNWCTSKAELNTLIGLILSFILYVYKPNLSNWLKLKIKNNFLFFYNLIKQEYFLNKLNSFILQKIQSFANLLFVVLENSFFNNYINNTTRIVVKYISKCMQNLHNNDLSNCMFFMFGGGVIILLWLMATTC